MCVYVICTNETSNKNLIFLSARTHSLFYEKIQLTATKLENLINVEIKSKALTE